MAVDVDVLASKALSGDKAALAKLITIAETDLEGASEILAKLRCSKTAHTVGVTGSGGVGKSTLISSTVKLLSKEGLKVGVVAVDPSSPFSGGALLGDRVRMSGLGGKAFIRSMSTSPEESIPFKALLTIEILERVGYDYIFLETPGVGQFNVDVAEAVDTVTVVLMPGLGDDIQALKAGLMEIGHIYVINKSDLPGADLVEAQIRSALREGRRKGWEPLIVKTKALSQVGSEPYVEALKKRWKFLKERKEELEAKRTSRRRLEVKLLVTHILKEGIQDYLAKSTEVRKILKELDKDLRDPISTAKEVMRSYLTEMLKTLSK